MACRLLRDATGRRGVGGAELRPEDRMGRTVTGSNEALAYVELRASKRSAPGKAAWPAKGPGAMLRHWD